MTENPTRLQPANSLRLRNLLVPSAGGAVSSVGWARAGGRLLLAACSEGAAGLQMFELEGDRLVPLGEPVTTTRGGGSKSMGWVRAGGRLLLAWSQGIGVQMFELEGDRLVPLGEPVTTTRSDLVVSVAWVQAGRRLLLATGGVGGLQMFELEGDRLVPLGEPVTTTRSDLVLSVAWVQAGRRLLLATGGNAASGVQLLELEGDRLIRRGEPAATPGGAQVYSMAWARAGGRLLLAAGANLGVGVQLYELLSDRLVPYGEPVETPRVGPVSSVGWVQAGGRLLLAAGGGVVAGVGGVQVFELEGDRLIPSGEHVGSRHDWPFQWVEWESEGGRLLLAAGSGGGLKVFELEEVQAVPRLPAYHSDTAGGADELARTGEARALAELLTATSARPPLAVGLFGEWGQGKSHFLRLLYDQVAAAARPDNSLSVHAVRQVRFNAWHYAETGLWPSLVAELFATLAAPGDDADPGTAQRSLSSLSAHLVTKRQLPERLRAAEARLADLTRAVRHSTPWEELPPAERAELVRLAGNDAKTADRWYTKAADTAVRRETLWAVVGLARRRPTATLAVCAVVAGTAAASWVWLPRWTVSLPVLASLLAILGAAGRLAAQARVSVAAFHKKLQDLLAREHSEIETAARLAAEEVAALKRQMQDLTAAGQLAGLVEDRAEAADYRSRLGVMTHIREDFERMATLLAGTSDESLAPDAGEDAAGDTLPQIDRIVLYIDDLDRCPPGQVVEMLEAIHLLLAVDLFVVVVAIDPRWLLAAIASHYREVLQATDGSVDGPGLSTPAQYLEKIFQVVFTLPPLETDGYQRLLHSMIAVRGKTAPQAAELSAAETPPTAPGTTHEAADSGDEDEDGDGPLYPVPHVQELHVVERIDPLMLTAEELKLLDLLGPPLMVTDPRSTKRLANSYGLLAALRRGERKKDLDERQQLNPTGAATGVTYCPYRAGMVLLAALVAYPASGPALCLHLHQRAVDAPEGGWREFCEHLARPDGHVQPPAQPVPGPQRRKLSRALLHVTDQAHDHGLDLPQTLGPWREWIIPAARLSFPAGQAIAALQRQERRETPADNGKPKP